MDFADGGPISVGSLIISNAPHWNPGFQAGLEGSLLFTDVRRGTWVQDTWGHSVLSLPFFCKSKNTRFIENIRTGRTSQLKLMK